MIALLRYWKLILGAVLIVLLASLWLLYRGQVAELGRLQTLNGELSRQVRQSEEDKQKLQATLYSNSKISAEDNVKQQAIQEQVNQLNKTISQLKSSNRLLQSKANEDKNCSYDDDPKLSADLILQLQQSYKGSGTSQPTK